MLRGCTLPQRYAPGACPDTGCTHWRAASSVQLGMGTECLPRQARRGAVTMSVVCMSAAEPAGVLGFGC